MEIFTAPISSIHRRISSSTNISLAEKDRVMIFCHKMNLFKVFQAVEDHILIIPLQPVIIMICKKRTKGAKKYNKVEAKSRVAFRFISELEVLDDGFKWRKYGKKMVKNSPYPRNYYKCSSGGCNVKKRVERDNEDSSYVITTYEGIHNHESPFVPHYTHSPPNNIPTQGLHSLHL
ncbi:hypothetical protein RND71_025119 [Anisodus tanguticus]|uniref:WRKY domain-containing protein n=1 Tax=Anisodus tanguticus TaxID=243964 RepID=A0AAE1RSG2_9SOLA|nr:hypothetical protein RND71_025119 [Anisodus tanguticus]